MSKGRLEIFSDGVIAILITIMVLELQLPDGGDWLAVGARLPTLLTYVMSFAYLAIYWNNHHHLLHVTQKIDGSVMWANHTLLFCLSLVPYTTAWMGRYPDDAVPAAAYVLVLFCASIAYLVLESRILRADANSRLARAVGMRGKEWVSSLAYVLAIPLAWWHPSASKLVVAAVALLWLEPDVRIERVIANEDRELGDAVLAAPLARA